MTDLEQAMAWLGTELKTWSLCDCVDGSFELSFAGEHYDDTGEWTDYTGDTPAEAVIAAWKEHGR